jgi:hypothetical protein
MPQAANEKINFEHKGIGEILSQNRLAVPLNQREYAWEDEHVTDLFRDFANAIANNKATYFLGTIVLTRGVGDIPEVSDGQQRLATTTILLAAIRDYFHRNGDTTRAGVIESTYLTTTDIRTTAITPKLRLNVDDNAFFQNYVLATPGTTPRRTVPTKDSHKRIARAAQIATEHVKQIVQPYSASAKTDRLLEWEEFIRQGAQVILLRVPDHMNAFVMFETLNDRGLKASQADLIKNYLFSHANERIQEAQQRWAKMIGVLETLGQEEVTVTYLHHLLITKFGPTVAREVFDKVRQYVNESESRSIQFLDELAESATDYAALFNSDHKKWNEYGTATRKHISTINRDLRVQQIRPLMFAVAHHFSVREAQRAFRLFVYWSVRFLIVGGRGGLLDRNYAVRAQDIGAGKIKTAKDLTTAMMDIIPSDALFETAFAEARVSQIHLARYYLRALEAKRKGDSEPQWIPQDDEQAVNLEHLLPENPQHNWPHVTADAADAYYKRIGNMVLLQAKKNSIAGNAPFSDKKQILQESTFLLTSEVAKYDTWGPEQIAERQQRLAKLAVETWPVQV